MAKGNNYTMIVVVVCIIVLAVALKGNYLGVSALLPVALGEYLFAVLPGLFMTIFGMYLVATRGRDPAMVAGFGLVGFGLAILFGEMYAAAIINDTLLAGATLIQLQAITIIVSILMGGVAYAAKR